MKHIVILGCTGSIGTQTLDIIRRFPDRFHLSGVSARGASVEKLVQIAREFEPQIMVVMDPESARTVAQANIPGSVTVQTGMEMHLALAAGNLCPADMVVSAISGTAGLEPTVAAVNAGINVALANKETLVTGGAFVMDSARKSGAELIPVDSEHAAIHQCLRGIHGNDLERLILTCSGGPFFNQPALDLKTVTPEMALSHPTWNMGRKITIDSATLMNKGLEIIEARWLFDVPESRIQVVIHPQSTIHSMVETRDGSIMAQLSRPDMRHPILYALSDLRHWACALPTIDFTQNLEWTFQPPDSKRFPCLRLAREALNAGGTMTAVLNTANERAVDAFCDGQILFTEIPEVIDFVMQRHAVQPLDSLEIIREADRWTRELLAQERGL